MPDYDINIAHRQKGKWLHWGRVEFTNVDKKTAEERYVELAIRMPEYKLTLYEWSKPEGRIVRDNE